MRFLVLGFDDTDTEAPARRQAARAAHLDGVSALCDAGALHYAGALLDADGNMNGSMMVLEYPSEETLRTEFLANEPYVKGGVWTKIEVYPHTPAAFLEAGPPCWRAAICRGASK